ncbi:MAG: hypothetical protein IT376_11695 [Polyangiaceae bacterium]|nr:hypothetical protein [Polyangiaceae bacterium]
MFAGETPITESACIAINQPARAQPPGGYGPPPSGGPPGGYGGPPSGGYGAPPSGGQPGVPAAPGAPAPGGSAPAKKKANPALLAAAGCGALLVLGGLAAGGGYLYLSRRAPSALPLPAERMPTSTRVVFTKSFDDALVSDLGVAGRADVPPEARWSYFAAKACGGPAIFDILMMPSSRLMRIIAAISMTSHRDDLRRSMTCGKAISDTVPSNALRYYVLFDETSLKSVSLFKSDTATLPPTTSRMARWSGGVGFQSAWCQAGDYNQTEAECKGDGHATGYASTDQLWVYGDRDEVGAFGQSLTGVGGSGTVTAMDKLAGDLRGFDRIVIGRGKDYVNHLATALHLGISTSLDDADKKLRDVVEEAVVAFALGQNGEHAGGKVALQFECKAESSATTLEAALKSYQQLMKGKVAVAASSDEDKKAATDDEVPVQKREYEKALRDAGRRALEAAEIKVSGTRVTYTADVQPNDAEKTQMKTYFEWRKTLATSVAKVWNAIYMGTEPDRLDLISIGGNELATEYTEQRAKGN